MNDATVVIIIAAVLVIVQAWGNARLAEKNWLLRRKVERLEAELKVERLKRCTSAPNAQRQ